VGYFNKQELEYMPQQYKSEASMIKYNTFYIALDTRKTLTEATCIKDNILKIITLMIQYYFITIISEL